MTQPLCTICGEPMPEGEDMFFYHGYSGPCPKPPLPKVDTKKRLAELLELARIKSTRRWQGADYPMNETGLGVEATQHLREILVLIEEAQKYVETSEKP